MPLHMDEVFTTIKPNTPSIPIHRSNWSIFHQAGRLFIHPLDLVEIILGIDDPTT